MKSSLIRLGGVTAVLCGILRGVSSVLPTTSPRIMSLYLLIDVLLLVSSVGLFEFQRLETGFVGTLAMLLQILGALILIARDLAILGDVVYPAGALIFAAGLDLFAIGSWRSRTLPRWIPALLVSSTVIGPVGFFNQTLGVLFAVSGLLFAIGFAGAGLVICRREQPSGNRD